MKKLISVISLIFIFLNGFSQIVINEFEASNKKIPDPQFKVFSDWVELYNGGNSDVNISGYYLTDNSTNSKKWQIPTGTNISKNGYLVIWLDGYNKGLHANFSLSADGEFLGLSDQNGKFIDSLSFGLQKADKSFGRISNGASTWVIFSIPSIGTFNDANSIYFKTEKPTFTLASGVYTGIQSIEINPISDAKIYYTTDGSTPTIKSTLYSGAISLSKTTVLKAKAFVAGEDESDVAACTYFINEHNFDLPILSISTDPNWLFNVDTGIYELGPYAQIEDPHYGANYWLDKEVPMTFQYYSPKGVELVNNEGGAKIYGGYSRMNPVKSMQFKCKTQYGGASAFHYQFFKDKNINEFKNIGIRNSGNDFGNTMFRDAFTQQLTKKFMKLDYQETQHAAFFINGEYYGLTMLIEKLNENYIASNYNIDPESVDLLDAWNTVLNGDITYWSIFQNYYTKTDLTDDANFTYIKTMMDMDEYIDYMITQLYINNRDWPGNNMKFWRERKTNAKWRWILYDTDFGFQNTPSSNCDDPMTYITDSINTNWPNPAVSTLLFRKLLKNKTFKNDFIQRLAYHMNTTFDTTRVIHTIDSIKTSIQNEMNYHIARWNMPADEQTWLNNIKVMRDFTYQRPSCVKNSIIDYFGLSGMADLTIKNDTSKGNIYLSSKTLDTIHFGSYFKDIAIPITVKERDGYIFKYWKKTEYTPSIINQSVIPQKSTWKYLDNGTVPTEAWKTKSFDETGWKTANGVFGYGESNITTTINYGTSTSNKYITTYFRKTFTINNLKDISTINLHLMRGDGAVVYINGVEAIRSNMPTGVITNQTTAFGADENDEISYLNFPLSTSLFTDGENNISVEVHQTSATSSDLSFDLEIETTSNLTSNQTITKDYNKNPQLFLKENTILEPVYQKLIPIAINEIQNQSSKGISGQFIELFNYGNYTVDLSNLNISGGIQFQFPANCSIKKGSFLLLCKDTNQYTSVPTQKLNWTNGYLTEIDTLLIRNNNSDTIDIITYNNINPWPINSNASNLSIELKQTNSDNNNGNNWQISQIQGGTPGGFTIKPKISNLFINECMTDNTLAYYDENEKYNDWIELFNNGTSAINIGGLYISDSDSNKAKYRIPDTDSNLTTIAPGKFLILWADNNPNNGILHCNFSLNKSGETVYLTQINYHDTIVIDHLSIVALDSNVSYGRYPDGSETLSKFNGYTPLSLNTLATRIKGLFINEVLPTNTKNKDESGDYDSWVEIFNLNSFQVDISGFIISNTKDKSKIWTLSKDESMKIPAYGHKLLWFDNEPNEGPSHVGLDLDKSKGWIGLYQHFSDDTLRINDLSYEISNPNHSFGRVQSGSDLLMEFQWITPQSWNISANIPLNVNNLNADSVTIYPVPLKETLNIANAKDIKYVTIYSIDGVKQLQSHDSIIDISKLVNGIYIIEISYGEKTTRILSVK